MHRGIHIRTTIVIAVALLTALAGRAGVANDDLPDIGSPASAIITISEEYQIGRMIVRRMQESGTLVTDPEIKEYIQSLGMKLATHAHDGEHRFNFFVVDDPALNAFALPGGFVGVNSGLILATKNESELAGVVAHEIAHVSQRHIARMVESAGQTSLLATAAMIAAILVGGAAGADSNAIQAAVVVAQGTAAQQQINFTRSNEYEADRVGIGFLDGAGFDPNGMPEFFKTMQRRMGLSGRQVPEYLRTHPLTTNRIAEAHDRAVGLGIGAVPNNPQYALARARLKVLGAVSAAEGLRDIEDSMDRHPTEMPDDVQYQYAIALLRAAHANRALEILGPLRDREDDVIAYRIAYAQALQATGEIDKGLEEFAKARRLFPRNVPLVMSYATALMEAGEPAPALEMMLDLVNNVTYTPAQIRILALTASAAGETADAHYYMSEFHVMMGDLYVAMDQLQMALATPGLADYQRARNASRLEEIRKHLPKKQRRPTNKERPDGR